MYKIRWHHVKLALLGTGIILLFNNWLLTPLLNPHLALSRSLISEISARTQPYHWLFQLCDISAGVLALASFPRVRQFLRQMGFAQAGWLGVGFAAVGVDSIVDALLPISCAPSVDTHCQLADTHSLITTIHLTESTVAGILIVLAPIAWWLATRRSHRPLAYGCGVFVGVQLAAGVGILGTRLLGMDVVGLLQRAYEIGIGTWMAYVAVLPHHWEFRQRTARAHAMAAIEAAD